MASGTIKIDSTNAWVVKHVDLTDESIEKIADAVVRKLREDDHDTDNKRKS